jgi:hypothetical protein
MPDVHIGAIQTSHRPVTVRVMEQLARSIVMALWSAGGQRTSRRNAWAAMAADAKRSRQRAEVAAFMQAVAAVHDIPVAAVAVAHA